MCNLGDIALVQQLAAGERTYEEVTNEKPLPALKNKITHKKKSIENYKETKRADVK